MISAYRYNVALSLLCFCLMGWASSCKQKESKSVITKADKKIGVLLVNHGSRSEAWRNGLLNLDRAVRDSIMKDGTVKDVKTAFMEYTEPSIATRLKEFDKEGFTDVVLVPVFLTVSSHSFDDIPTLIGQKDDPKSIELFKIEKMERYTPQTKVHLTPLLDFTDLLRRNVLRRFQAVSKDAANEGLVLMAYGDKTYNTEWTKLLSDVGDYVKAHTALTEYNYGWCGHIAHYSQDSTKVPVQAMLKKKESAVVIPVLVAFDEMFQVDIIGGGIKKLSAAKEKITYKPDAILPDPGVQHWVVSTATDFANKIQTSNAKQP